MDNQGYLHVLFWGWTGPQSEVVHGRRSQAGGPWQVTVVVRTEQVNSARWAVQPSGEVHVLWVEGTAEARLRYRSATSRGVWSDSQTIASNELDGGLVGIRSSVALAVGPGGLPHVVWNTEHSGRLLTTRRRSDGRWTEPFEIARGGAVGDSAPMAIDGGGIAHLAYLLGQGWGSGRADLIYANTAVPTGGASRLTQSVTVPAGAAQTLSFFAQLHGAAEGGDGRLEVRVNGATLSSMATRDDRWQHRWLDLTPWSGQGATLTFALVQSGGQPCTWAYLDDVSVGSTYPDLWVSASGHAVLPGQPVLSALRFGNQGAVPAAGAFISVTLPVELTFVSATPPPTMVNGKTLRWEVGNLPASSPDARIVVTAQQAAPMALGTALTIAAEIRSATPEVEGANNAVRIPIRVARASYLPLLLAEDRWP